MNTYRMWDLNPFLGPFTSMVMEIFWWPLGAIDKIFSYKSAGFRLKIGFAAVALLGFYAASMLLLIMFQAGLHGTEIKRGLLFYGIGLVLYRFLVGQLEKKLSKAA